VARGGVVVALCGRQQRDSRLSVEHLADVCAEPDRGRGASGQVVITDNGRYRLAVPPDRLDAAARSGGDWPPAHPNSLAILRI
jgi:hypothetical protein